MKGNVLIEAPSTPYDSVPFDKIKTDMFLPAIEHGLELARKEIEKIKGGHQPTFENTILALETSDEKLSIATSAYYHLFAAHADEELQALAPEISSKLAAFSNDIFLDPDLFERVKAVFESEIEDPADQRLTRHYYLQFKRNGALLQGDDKEKLREIDEQLAKLKPAYSENVLKATNDFELLLSEPADTAGLPPSVLEQAKEAAEAKDKSGYLFTLQAPSFLPFMTYAENRGLRKKMYLAYGSRAYHDQYSNHEIVKEITLLRHQRAQLLGYESHAHYTLEERMAKTPARVNEFLDQLLQSSLPAAKDELAELAELLKADTGSTELMPWDVRYYTEKLKLQKYNFDQESLRVFFSLDQVLPGIFQVAEKLYQLTFDKVDAPVYHPDVDVFEVKNADGSHVGLFYVDLFPRETKKAGAWMNDIRAGGLFAGKARRPHVSIVCNFTRPGKNKPALLTFEEVNTLFHEFGHGLHSLLSTVKYTSLAGTHVYWDFVELPSQIMENWLLEKETLDVFASHFETGEAISVDLVERLKRARQFMAGYYTIRQLSFAYLDMAWHSASPSVINDLAEFEEKAMKETRVLPAVEGTNVSCGFSHIFSGGYSAGYYSYKWAEVLDADAFELFKKEGIFNQKVAQRFRNNILEMGNLEEPMQLYKKFRGREPDVKALLKRDGLVA